ncbi:conserved hypothetical protein [Pseudomonas protegens Pf-5]|uniref:Uncharacterized protein n=1 Tax=Pseudomonas fluorescens (strain ATCC BAA-477 / NRRL B-23932 / Pf-5) TaxID=220664 RepID=Q4KDS2_PSEF5|nr:conserved hypothetical protein [Pseudomonas protegens Pf-5]
MTCNSSLMVHSRSSIAPSRDCGALFRRIAPAWQSLWRHLDQGIGIEKDRPQRHRDLLDAGEPRLPADLKAGQAPAPGLGIAKMQGQAARGQQHLADAAIAGHCLAAQFHMVSVHAQLPVLLVKAFGALQQQVVPGLLPVVGKAQDLHLVFSAGTVASGIKFQTHRSLLLIRGHWRNSPLS